jgi:hypothetical protein
MNTRRGFLKSLATAVATVVLPMTVLSYDPIKQKVVKPVVNTIALNGYKGAQFFETGFVYRPYIPLQIVPMSRYYDHA